MNRTLIQIVAAAGLVTILFFLFRYNQARSQRVEMAMSIPKEAAPSDVKKSVPLQAPAYTASGRRDPLTLSLVLEHHFFPPKPPKEQKEALAPLKFKVTGILWSGPKPKAIVNGKIVGEGDTVEGAKIVRIDPHGVVVSAGAQEITLSILSVKR